MKEDLSNIINMEEDKILIINTGKINKKDKELIFTMGVQIDTKNEASIVI